MLHLPFLLFVGRINGRILFQRKLTLRLPANNNINISDKAAIQRPPISPMSKFRSLIAYVINSTGKVKIINVDPLRPNLRKLEQ